jgi:molybdate transport system permease protein
MQGLSMLSAEEIQVLATSFAVALRAVLWTLPFAVAAAYALSRPNFPGKSVFDAVVHLPLVLPPVLIGFFLLLIFGRRGPIGAFLDQAFNIRLAFTMEAAAIATAVMMFPLMVRSIRLAFEATDARLLEAASTLRADPWDRFLTIALPLAWPGIVAGAVTAFAAGLGEFGAVITFAANVPGQTQTLPLAIYSALQLPGGEEKAMRLAGLSLALAVAGLAAGEALQQWRRRRLEA